MKYIITAKGSHDVNKGNGSYEGGTPIKQTECATELIINRLGLISLLKTGEVNKDTIVVTLPERQFLYTNIFKTTEIYDPSKQYNNCIDLVSNDKLSFLCKTLPCLLYTSPSPRDRQKSRMPSSA